MTKERRLGRGLAALLGEAPNEFAANPGLEPQSPAFDRSDESSRSDADAASPHLHRPPDAPSDSHPNGDSQTLLLDVHEIRTNPFQPRREFGEAEILSLAESLKEHQQLQPILVRRVDDHWELISGERRLRAAIRAGLPRIQAMVRDADDRLVAELAIVENLQRKDLNPLEKALSFQRYIQQHNCTQDELGQRLKIDRSTIANLLRLLELPEEAQDSLRRGTITAGHARALLPLGDERQQIEFGQRIRREGLSVRVTEREVQEIIEREDRQGFGEGQNAPPKSGARKKSDQLAALERDLRRSLGTKVDLQQATKGRGKIVIHFTSAQEFERIRAQITGEHSQPVSDVG